MIGGKADQTDTDSTSHSSPIWSHCVTAPDTEVIVTDS